MGRGRGFFNEIAEHVVGPHPRAAAIIRDAAEPVSKRRIANEAFLKRDGQRPGVLRDRHRRVLEEVPLLDAEPRRG
jgi:hypothetical protein